MAEKIHYYGDRLAGREEIYVDEKGHILKSKPSDKYPNKCYNKQSSTRLNEYGEIIETEKLEKKMKPSRLENSVKNSFLTAFIVLLPLLWLAIFIHTKLTGNAVLENFSLISGSFSFIFIVLIVIALVGISYIRSLRKKD